MKLFRSTALAAGAICVSAAPADVVAALTPLPVLVAPSEGSP